jgi:uncharacterized RDD family membrane protein YckC
VVDLEDRYVSATPEGVSLSVVLAGLGSRFVAYLIDFLIQAAVFVAFILVLGLAVSGSGETSGLVATGATSLFAFIDFFGYFVVCDMFFSGRSIGKRATGLRVVRADGGPVGFWGSALRNILRLVDMIPFPLYLVGSVLILSTTRNQRLGDLGGGSVVIRERTAVDKILAGRAWSDTTQWISPVGGGTGWVPVSPAGPGVLPPELAHWDVSAVRPADIMVAGMFLSNRFGYTPEARHRLAVELANGIWPAVAGAPPTMAPEQFLEAVVLVKSVRG